MTFVNAQALAGFALLAWTGIVCALLFRTERRAFGHASMSWLAVCAALAVGTIAVTVRPLSQSIPCGIACIALALAADADARTGYLFDAVTLPTAAVVLIAAALTGSVVPGLVGSLLLVAIFGTVVGLSHGRAMGMGDVKAMASIGAAFGPVEALFAVAAACVSGIIEATIRGRLERRGRVRFGPHLAIGAAVALAWGEPFFKYATGA